LISVFHGLIVLILIRRKKPAPKAMLRKSDAP